MKKTQTRMTPGDVERAVALYRMGWTAKRIGEGMNRQATTIGHRLRAALGADYKPQHGGAGRQRKHKRDAMEPHRSAIKIALMRGRTKRELAREFNVNLKTLETFLEDEK